MMEAVTPCDAGYNPAWCALLFLQEDDHGRQVVVKLLGEAQDSVRLARRAVRPVHAVKPP